MEATNPGKRTLKMPNGQKITFWYEISDDGDDDTLAYERWKKFAGPDVDAFLDRVLEPLERFPYAVPTGADRYKPLDARGMPIKELA